MDWPKTLASSSSPPASVIAARTRSARPAATTNIRALHISRVSIPRNVLVGARPSPHRLVNNGDPRGPGGSRHAFELLELRIAV